MNKRKFNSLNLFLDLKKLCKVTQLKKQTMKMINFWENGPTDLIPLLHIWDVPLVFSTLIDFPYIAFNMEVRNIMLTIPR